MAQKKRRKVIIVGLDGATFDLLDPWLIKNKLPNIKEIITNGVKGELLSSIPPVSPTAWTSFATGKNPGKHGIYDFKIKKNKSYERILVNASNIDGKTLWSILSDSGKKVGIVHVPLTYPIEKVNGVVVTDYVLSPSVAIYPPELEKEVFEGIPGYKKIYTDNKLVRLIPGMEDSYIEGIYNAIEKEGEVTLFIYEKYDFDFFMTVFALGDQLQHFFWKYIDKNHPKYEPIRAKKFGNTILEYYVTVDKLIGKLRDNADSDTTFLIMSDHGFGPLNKTVFINHWLIKLGLLKLKSQKSVTKIKHSILNREKITNLVENNSLFRYVGMNLIPRSITRKIFWAVPPSSRPTLNDIDYSQTKAYSTGSVGQIFLNVIGRDPQGLVDPTEFNETRDFLITKLLELKDPDNGEKLVDKIFLKEDIYHGQHINNAPDIFFIMKNMSYITYSGDFAMEFGANLDSITCDTENISGYHRLNGIFIIMGPDIRKSEVIENSRIIDIAPTVLHIMGVPISSDMDGKVLKNIFLPDTSLAKKRIIYQQVEKISKNEYKANSDEEEELKNRLRALGYIR